MTFFLYCFFVLLNKKEENKNLLELLEALIIKIHSLLRDSKAL